MINAPVFVEDYLTQISEIQIEAAADERVRYAIPHHLYQQCLSCTKDESIALYTEVCDHIQ